jgi:beta-lactamase class A
MQRRQRSIGMACFLAFLSAGLWIQSGATESLKGQIETVARSAQGRVGVAIMELETGDSVAVNGDQPFPMQSVYKFPIGMAVLRRVDLGQLKLAQKVKIAAADLLPSQMHSPIRDRYPSGTELSVDELLRFMVAESDGTACDVLLNAIGGPEIVAGYLHSLGINRMLVTNREREIGQDSSVQYRNSATPDSAIALLREFFVGKALSPASRALLLRWMTETSTGLERIKGLLPPGAVVAHKTGSSRTVNGFTAATNDIGIITLLNGQHLAVAIFIADSTEETQVREKVIATIARLAWDHWNIPTRRVFRIAKSGDRHECH